MTTPFPDKDPGKIDAELGLYNKFKVERVDGKYPDRRYFVLDIDKDPHALPALHAYAVACFNSHPELSYDLFRLLREIYK